MIVVDRFLLTGCSVFVFESDFNL